ncbi:MAG TPA: DUF5996 family protein, partial [Xanthobacteraceae bacterium]|nr:DUF5996 family protein [Xanthobacteraceae bacterium]
MISANNNSPDNNAWLPLAYADWQDTCNTLHLWTQIVGKVKLALAPLSNHWWGIVLYVTARGLTTGAMPYANRVLQIDFDFCAHELVMRSSDAREERIALAPMATADFYAAVMKALRSLDVDLRIWTMPVEIEGAIPFEQDRVHASYDGAAAQTFWRQLVQADRVFNIFRARFLGKVSPVHFFWGSFDLAVTRFSGRAAPPLQSNNSANVAAWVMNEAYSHECSSVGFWPGNGGYGRAAFYAYAYPEPGGCGTQQVRPQTAAYNADIGQFLIDYDAVRTAAAPDDALLD